MAEDSPHGDRIEVGTITNAQGIAIGRGASARVAGDNLSGDTQIDLDELRSVLEDLHQFLADAELGRGSTISAQTAVGKVLESVGGEGGTGPVLANLRAAGETLQQANVVVDQGSALWQSIARLSVLLAPLAGGARIIASWFGITLP